MALSADGTTLAVGAHDEDSNATGIDGDQTDNSAYGAGAVYVFIRDSAGNWMQQAYIKASNAEGVNDPSLSYTADHFGFSVDLSADGNTLVVGARGEDSAATTINGLQGNDGDNNGAAYVFVRDAAGNWTEQAYIKPSTSTRGTRFGVSVSLSSDGNTLAVGANTYGNIPFSGTRGTGAAFVFVRDTAGTWTEQAFLRAANRDDHDNFGLSVALSGDGNTLAVGATLEDSAATGINSGLTADNTAADSGAAYVFVRDGAGAWSQQAYVKASNTGAGDNFGHAIALNGDGSTLVVGASREDSAGTGVNNASQGDDSAADSGAAYVFVRDAMNVWTQQAYIKASNTGAGDLFGGTQAAATETHGSIGLSADGNTLVIGAPGEASSATGIGGNASDDSLPNSGAAYVFTRNGATWTQQAYVKASSATPWLGDQISLSADGNTLAAGSPLNKSNATGVGGDQSDTSAFGAGAVFLY
ncbi:MAG TPA: integrin [Gammaproteobacteria bacterium]|nr:integrin [Gammaproteobacteria bacterium]